RRHPLAASASELAPPHLASDASQQSDAVIGLATGIRRGEIAALRWADVDLDTCKIRVERSLEQTNAGLAIKLRKTKAGRRIVSIRPSIAAELREHWHHQQERRLALGMGKAGGANLMFALPDESPWPPDSLSGDWARTVRMLRLPKVSFHSLRHAHV